MSVKRDIITENVFESILAKRKQAKIEEMVMEFLKKQRKIDGSGYSAEKIAEATGLDVSLVSFALKSSLLYKKWVDWVEHEGVDFFRATSAT